MQTMVELELVDERTYSGKKGDSRIIRVELERFRSFRLEPPGKTNHGLTVQGGHASNLSSLCERSRLRLSAATTNTHRTDITFLQAVTR